jgi:glutamyl-tRNA synthetase
MKIDEDIRKYAFQNAVLFDGKANEKAVVGKVIAEHPELKREVKVLIPIICRIVSEVNKLSLDEQKAELEKRAPELLYKEKKAREVKLPELLNAKDKVVMRLAPYPSGPLHIGNARMVILNDEYVKKYNGKLILVFDDTIGSEEKIPLARAYEQIIEGLDWLGVRYDEIIYKSDRMEIFYEWAEKLLKLDYGYVCECPPQKLRENREKRQGCEHRDQSVKVNLQKWKEMLNGKFKEGQAVVRLKSDMSHKNPAFRDRVLLRISEREHPRVGKKYRVWPLLEFSWAVDDYLLGITHILRGKDLIIEDEMESFIWNIFGLEKKEFVHYGMLRLKDLKLSKSKFRREIEAGTFSGIYDPRTWTLQSLKKRGIKPKALRNFILSFGMSLTDIEVPAENLYHENKKIVDPIASRYFFVHEPIKIKIEKLPDIKTAYSPLHPNFSERGTRKLKVKDEVHICKEDFEKFKGKEIRLKDFCNIRLNEKAEFTSKKVKDIPKIQWICEGIPVDVIMPDGKTIKGLGEKTLEEVKVDDIIQFERFGFVRIDEKNKKITTYFAHK